MSENNSQQENRGIYKPKERKSPKPIKAKVLSPLKFLLLLMVVYVGFFGPNAPFGVIGMIGAFAKDAL